MKSKGDFEINDFVRMALVYSKLQHRGTLLFKCSDSRPCNTDCPRCQLISLLMEKN